MAPRPPATDHARPGAGRRALHPLIALNAVLVLVLCVVTLSPPVGAEQPRERARGDYTMVGGSIRGGASNAVFVVDSVNQELIAVRWNHSRRQLEGIGYRNLGTDATRPRQAR
ncbi:MAG: hypothetical protein EA378_06635 [Phycisphaerales bacterium]|nr:MAG: hypothetical protein EA378_06635 [Phycisphaerales bacterium]